MKSTFLKSGILTLLLLLLIASAYAATVQSHPAEQIKAGAFQSGSYKFPGNIAIGADATAGDRLKVKATSGNAVNAECTSCDAVYATSSTGYSGYFAGGKGVKIENDLSLVKDTNSVLVQTSDGYSNTGIELVNRKGNPELGKGDSSYMDFHAGTTVNDFDARIWYKNNKQGGTEPTGLGFFARPPTPSDTGLANAQLFITPAGNVGIGTTNPSQKLQVTGNLAITGRIDSGIVHGQENSANAAVYGENIADGYGIYGKSVSGYSGYFAGGKGVKIENDLSLVKDTNSVLVQTSDGYSNTGIELVNRKGNPELGKGDSSYMDFHAGTTVNDFDARIWYKNNKQGGTEPTGLGFFARPPTPSDTGLANAQLFITPAGNVGIGTTSPGAQLQLTHSTNSIIMDTNYGPVSNPGIEIINRAGNPVSGVGDSAFIDFHAGAAVHDWDARIWYKNNKWGGSEPSGLGFFARPPVGVSEGINNAQLFITPAGNVGIGTTNPLRKLEVIGGTSNGIFVTSSVTAMEAGSVAGNGIVGTSSSATGVWGGSQTGNGVYGSTNSASASGVYGENAGSGYGIAGISASGYGVYCKGTTCGGTKAWSISSDARLKKNITTIENALEKVEKLRGVSFVWKNDTYHGKNLGFIAQELEKVVPELVNKGQDGYYTAKTSELTALLVEAMKEQQKQIESQQQEIDQLKEDIRLLQSKN